MASELLCITHKNANDLARGQLGMGRKAKAMSGCLINFTRNQSDQQQLQSVLNMIKSGLTSGFSD